MSNRWASACRWEHSNSDRLEMEGAYSSYGENLFALGPSSVDTPPGIVNPTIAWYNEVDHYTYNGNTCEAGEMCGHYKQVSISQPYYVRKKGAKMI